MAKKALSAGHFIVAVTGHPSESVDAHADVVLPCAVAHERPGTTTNLEGRVTRLGHKLTAPGFAWPDWMIAAELAAALGADLGVSSANDLADEVHLTAPAYAGLTAAVLNSDVAHDGIRRPHRRGHSSAASTWIRSTRSLCPASSRWSARAHRPARAVAEGDEVRGRCPRGDRSARPPLISRRRCSGRGRRRGRRQGAARPDNYALRLVAGRRLYDAGSSVTGSPSLTTLVPALVARANPYDLDRLGAKTGDRVRVRSARGELVLEAEVDAACPKGVVAIDFNVPRQARARTCRATPCPPSSTAASR